MGYKKGTIVRVVIDDHSIQHKGSVKDSSPMRFTIYGEVKSNRGKHLILFTWKHHNEECCDNNSEIAKILKSTIVNIKELKAC